MRFATKDAICDTIDNLEISKKLGDFDDVIDSDNSRDDNESMHDLDNMDGIDF